MKRVSFSIALALFAGACAYSASEHGMADAPAPDVSSSHEYDRLAFVQAACGGCHSVEPPDLSPNPMSPPFADIANREGLTKATLISWLTDAHNYPEMMDFDLDPDQVDDIASYILTLRSDEYRKLPG
ncbi:MAG: cytochrome c [Altererythrobacter sp.]|nr:cytochrome c [Altererythrobacter sp.]NNF94902.1 cytochrome c [Altererythrobacter sp.]NNK45514.1 cytochrome c [Altererythrobacter sp.]